MQHREHQHRPVSIEYDRGDCHRPVIRSELVALRQDLDLAGPR